jgi:hypothetical protein
MSRHVISQSKLDLDPGNLIISDAWPFNLPISVRRHPYAMQLHVRLLMRTAGRPYNNQAVADTRVRDKKATKRTTSDGQRVPLLRRIDTFGRSAVIS